MRFVQNAREALPGGCGTIEFTTHTDSRNWVVVTIRDSGCGMSQEVQRRATEPFFSTKPDHAGRRPDDRPGHLAEASRALFRSRAVPARERRSGFRSGRHRLAAAAPQGEQGRQSSASPTA